MIYTFSEHESEYAYKTWGANCGPNALAFALQTTLEAVRFYIPLFDQRRYASPTMMKEALQSLHRAYLPVKKPNRADMFASVPSLCRIQWGGPWIVGGKPQRWAARQTHWICCWKEPSVDDRIVREWVFDVNGGIESPECWEQGTCRRIIASVSRADGTWYPANIWRLV